MEKEILLILDDKSNPSLAIMDIYDKLGLETTEELTELQATLNMMVEDGTLYYSDKKKKYIVDEEEKPIVESVYDLSANFFLDLNEIKWLLFTKDTLNDIVFKFCNPL